MADRILNIGFIGNGKDANRYHMPFSLALPEKFRIKTVYARDELFVAIGLGRVDEAVTCLNCLGDALLGLRVADLERRHSRAWAS